VSRIVSVMNAPGVLRTARSQGMSVFPFEQSDWYSKCVLT
jgi:hypothetical protein